MKTSLLVLFLLFSTLLFCQEEAYKEGKISPYTAYFISTLQNFSSDTLQQKTIQKRFGIKRQTQQQMYIDAFIELNEISVLDVLREFGVEIGMVLENINIITARIPVEKIETISLIPEVKQVEIGTPIQKKLNKARPAANIDLVQTGTGLSMPYKGKDVIIGIIDGGFDLNHTNFYSSDKSEYRIKRFWNQNNEAGTSPDNYKLGSEYKTQAEIQAAGYDYKTETHGTHVAGIAAGADMSNENPYYGVAPESDLVLVSYDVDDGNTSNVFISNAIKYIYDYAGSVNKPAVVNMSLGTQYGPHDGTSTFDRVCDEIQGEGRLLVGAVGNEASAQSHISKSFSLQDDLLKTFIPYFDSTELYGLVDIWGEESKSYTAQLVSYNVRTGEESGITDILVSSTASSKSMQLSTPIHGVAGTLTIYTGINRTNKRGNILFVLDMTSLSNNYKIGLKITANEGTVNAWTNSTYYFSGENITNWANGDGYSSIGEIGGTGKRIISVGAYTTKESFRSVNGKEYTYRENLNNITSFSSQGPTLDGRMKPDITAPGSAVVSSYSDAVAGNNMANIVFQNGTDYYGTMEGTSMAAPFVTGVLASWLQVKNNLTPEEVRYIFQETAINDEYTGDILNSGSNTWGYGKIDAWSGIKKCIELKRQEDLTEVLDSIANIYGDIAINTDMKSRILYLEVLTDKAENIQMMLFNINGQKVMQRGIPSGIGVSSINMSEIQGGVFVVSFTGKNLNVKTQYIILP